jgi:tight adherence protein B
VRRVLVAALVALVVVPTAAAATRIGGVDAGSFPSVRVTVLADQGSAQPRLTENGKPVAGLEAYNLGAQKTIALAVDRSQSMRGRPLADAIAAAKRFTNDLRARDRVGVVAFGSSAIALDRGTSSPGDATEQLGALRVDSKSGTALYDAVVLAAEKLKGVTDSGRAIVVVTDGRDVSSLSSLGDAVQAAAHARAAIYTIGIGGPDFTAEPLQELASRTGGTFRRVSSVRDLAATYRALSRELARTWQLTYLTSARPGEKIDLAARTPGGRAATTTFELPSSGDAAPDSATGLIPSAGYSAAGTFLIAIAVGGLMLLACLFWFASQRGDAVRARIEPHLGDRSGNAKARRRQSRDATRARLATAIENALADVKQFKQVQRLIERADLPLRSGELLAMCGGIAIVLGFFSIVFGSSWLMTLVLVGVGFWAPIGWVSFKARGRVREFENQLPDLLITLAASLKAGHSFRQGIQSVVDEGAEPAAKEFQRVLAETQLGRPIDDALADMAERVGSENFSFVITAVTIQRQIGGSLSGLFDMVAETVRQRQQFARRVRSLTAMGRMSAYVLVALPFFLATVVTIMNPAYMAPLYHTSLGQKMLATGVVMLVVGSLILKKIASFRG